MRAAIAAGLTFSVMISAPVHAVLPSQLKTMLDDAIATGSDVEIDAVAKYLHRASPADGAEIDAAIAARRTVIAAAKEEKLRNAGLFDNWSG